MKIYSFSTYYEANLFKTLRGWEGYQTSWYGTGWAVIVWY